MACGAQAYFERVVPLPVAQEKVAAANVRLSASSALVISGADVSIRGLDLDGAVVVEAAPGARVVIDGAHVRNGGWKWQALKPEKPMTEEQFIRCGLVYTNM